MIRKTASLGNSAGYSAFAELASAGFYVALRVGFHYPLEEVNELPEGWVRRYTERGLLLQDPVMHWVYGNSGAVRWSEIRLEDPRGVLEQARRYGLCFGVAISHADNDSAGQRSFGTFSRADREFRDEEMDRLSQLLRVLHEERMPPKNLTRAELEALRMVKNGLLMKEIADLLGVSEGAVKQRLRNAKVKLKAKTSTHAATMATSYGLI